MTDYDTKVIEQKKLKYDTGQLLTCINDDLIEKKKYIVNDRNYMYIMKVMGKKVQTLVRRTIK